MSPENIKKLRHLLDQSDKIMEKRKYVEILNRWEKGDFSQAVENMIICGSKQVEKVREKQKD